MFSGPWSTGIVETSPTQGTVTLTSMYDPNFTLPAQNVTYNESYIDIVNNRTKYCWITGEDHNHGYDYLDYAAICQSYYWSYCIYNSSAPSPTAMTRFPAVCTPDRSWYTLPGLPSPVDTPTPIQDGMTKGCIKFHKVVTGDDCTKIATAGNVTLSDFYKWNPGVGVNTCTTLWIGAYVCVGYDSRLDPNVNPSVIGREVVGEPGPTRTPAPVFLSFD